MPKPEEIAAVIVDKFPWSTNMMRNGRLVGQQYLVADEIAKAIAVETMRLRKALEDIRQMAATRRAKIRMPSERTGRSGDGPYLEKFITAVLSE